MKWAIIKNGVVLNIVIATKEYAESQGWILCDNAGPEWTYLDGVFYPPEKNNEIEKNFVRQSRNLLLKESDFIATIDIWSKLSNDQQKAWEEYRQALRDIPLQTGFPSNVDWPIKPSL